MRAGLDPPCNWEGSSQNQLRRILESSLRDWDSLLCLTFVSSLARRQSLSDDSLWRQELLPVHVERHVEWRWNRRWGHALFAPFRCCCESSGLQTATTVQLRGRGLLTLLLYCLRRQHKICCLGHFPARSVLGGGILRLYLGIPQANATELLLCSQRNPWAWVFVRSSRDCPTGHWPL